MMKRLLDFSLTIVVFLLLLPILLILGVVIAMKLGFPIFFIQERPGKNGRPFNLIKFRTMTSVLDAEGDLLPDALRLTRFGRFLRSTSLDELPSLWNVIKGDVSLVGPRPLLMEYLPLYTKEQSRRHEVRPGITGWAQVNGRNAISWDKKFKLDVWYVDNQSFWLDLKILFLTLWKVVKRSDTSAQGEATMPKFIGNKE